MGLLEEIAELVDEALCLVRHFVSGLSSKLLEQLEAFLAAAPGEDPLSRTLHRVHKLSEQLQALRLAAGAVTSRHGYAISRVRRQIIR